MSDKLPPMPVGIAPGSSYWNDWYEKLRNLVNDGLNVLFTNLNFTGSNLTSIATRNHNDLQTIQGGTTNQYYHLTQAQSTSINSGLSVTIVTAKLTGAGVNGSMTFTNGILTAQTQAT